MRSIKQNALAAAALALFGTTGSISAHAAGPFDGLYQSQTDGRYFSVHQSGSLLRVGQFGTAKPSAQDWILSGDGGTTFSRTPELGFWGIASGPVDGNVAVIQGDEPFYECFVRSRVTLNADGSLTFVTQASGQTATGVRYGSNCNTPRPTFTAQRIG